MADDADIDGKKMQELLVNFDEAAEEKNGDQGSDAPEGVQGVKSFEDLLEIVGTFGRWNIMTFILLNTSTFMAPFQFISYEFIGATPDHWCRVGTLMDANWTQQQVLDLAIPHKNGSLEHERCQMYDYNYTLAVELGYETALKSRVLLSEGRPGPIRCYSRDFNYSQYQSTLVTEFDLVCERRVLYSSTQAAAQGGHLVGGVLAGCLNDMFGRRPVVLVCVIFSVLTGLGAAASPILEIYILMKFLVCGFLFAIYSTCFVLLIEICSPSQRSSVASLFLIPWALSYMIMPGIAYFIRPWRWLQFAYTIPVFILFVYFWVLPESPRWLISEKRYDDAVQILSWVAKTNRRSLPPSEDLVASMKKLAIEKEEKPKESLYQTVMKKSEYLLALVIAPEFRVRALVCYFCWFSVSMVYHGVALNSGNLSANPYLYMFLGGLVEVPSYILLWPSLAYLGRKWSLVSQYLACAVSIATIAILLSVLDHVPVGILMFFSLTGKLIITATFHLMFVYTAELFPTKYRSIAVGESSMMARVGSMISPYVNDLLGDAISWGPSALFALVAVMAAALGLILPETKGDDLNETKTFEKERSTENIDAENGDQAKSSDQKL